MLLQPHFTGKWGQMQLPGATRVWLSDVSLLSPASSPLWRVILCNLFYFKSASALPGHSSAAGEHTSFLLCLAIRTATTFEKHEISKWRNAKYLPSNPPNMEKQSEYTKLEKHTQNGCLKFTAVNIKYFVWEKECKKHQVNKIAADGSLRAED